MSRQVKAVFIPLSIKCLFCSTKFLREEWRCCLCVMPGEVDVVVFSTRSSQNKGWQKVENLTWQKTRCKLQIWFPYTAKETKAACCCSSSSSTLSSSKSASIHPIMDLKNERKKQMALDPRWPFEREKLIAPHEFELGLNFHGRTRSFSRDGVEWARFV